MPDSGNSAVPASPPPAEAASSAAPSGMSSAAPSGADAGLQAADGGGTPAGQRVWSRTYRTTTAGLFALAFLFAFEALAVATVMPVVARDLDGLSLYALAFGAPMALSVVSIGLGGGWSDARGPGPALRLGVLLFSVGLAAAALAPTMGLLLVGRGLQGFGSGLASVAMYVVVARAYPVNMRPQAFTVLTSGWVLPGVIGPVIAGAINEVLGWRWVFGIAPVLAVVAYLALEPVLRSTRSEGQWRPRTGPVLWSAAAAAGVLGLGSLGGQGLSLFALPLLGVSVLAVLLGGPRLLPKGTWTLRRGLPAVIASRGLVGAAFVGAEAYLPLALVEQRGFAPVEAGALLSVSALTWFGGSWLAANLRFLAPKIMRVRIGVALMAIGMVPALAAVHPEVSVAVVIAGWAVAGLGIGMGFSTLSVLLLDWSARGEEGANSSALQINDNLVQSLWLAVGGIGFAALLPASPVQAFTAVFSGAVVLGVGALALTARLRPAGEGEGG